MKVLYYKIWADAIATCKSNPLLTSDWKIMALLGISIPLALNLMFSMAIFQRNIINYSFYHLNLNIFNSKFLDTTIESLTLFLLPPVLLNYFLMYYNKKYLMVIEKYTSVSKNYFQYYFIIVTFMPLSILIIALIFR
jgi:hypothetical protein